MSVRRLHESKKQSWVYMLRNGLGPGTLPKDVEILHQMEYGAKDLVWLDRQLTDEEISQYDIIPRTKMKQILGSDKELSKMLDAVDEFKTTWEESYDRYDPNVEAFFDDNMGAFEYNDMPDLEDLYAANKGLPIEEFIKDAEEHGFPEEAIMRFLYPERYEPDLLYKSENVRRRNKYMKEGFWDSYLSLSKKIYSVVKSELSGKKHDFSLEDIQMAFDAALEKIQNSSDKFGL